jgi:hypothetical protein
VKSFPYEHVPAAATIVALTDVGDRESRSRAFSLARAMDVRVYALGEGRDGRMFDYGWITNAATHQKVWQMEYGETEHAGGAAKNRLADRTIHLDKGDYVVHYVTDDSHSADLFNASAPPDPKRWGITLLAASGTLERGAVSEYAEKPDTNVIAQIVGVRDDESPKKKFTLDRETTIRVYALGESSASQHGGLRVDRRREDRPHRVGDDVPLDRTGRRRGEEPALRRHDHPSGRRVHAPLRDRRFAFVRVVERKPSRRTGHVRDHPVPHPVARSRAG